MSDDANLTQRRRMLDEQVRTRGLRDERVLTVMERIPRERFVCGGEGGAAFSDRALPIACGQTISQPFMVAAMTSALKVGHSHRVLEIGTGSGYQTAVLAAMAGHVYSIERIAPLQDTARPLLWDMGFCNISFRVGDGSAGWPEEAPFDRIIVTAGAPEIPRSLVEQLGANGRMVIPVGRGAEQTLTVLERSHGRIVETPGFACRFVRLIGREGWDASAP